MFSASDSLLIKEMFQSKVTRTGTLVPSRRQQQSRKISKINKDGVAGGGGGVKSAFSFFRKQKKPEMRVILLSVRFVSSVESTGMIKRNKYRVFATPIYCIFIFCFVSQSKQQVRPVIGTERRGAATLAYHFKVSSSLCLQYVRMT